MYLDMTERICYKKYMMRQIECIYCRQEAFRNGKKKNVMASDNRRGF